MTQESTVITHPDVTRNLARFALQTKFEMLPAEVVQRSKDSFMDTVGVGIGGSQHPASAKVRNVASALGGESQATVYGRRERMNIAHAAWCNAYAAHVFDYDDTHYEFLLHANTPLVPAILAAAEWLGSNGREMIEAYVVGYEIESRITRALWPYHHRQGWHVTGTVGTFAAAAAVAKLLKLDEEKFIYALGTAGAQAAGLQANRGTMSKGLHPSKAAYNGILAALLGREGFTSSTEIVEHPKGFAANFTPQFDLDKIQFGHEEYEVLRGGYKPYPCGVVIHTVIDCAIALRDNIENLDDVERIEFRVHPYVERVTGVKRPDTGLKAKFSTVHCAAVGLLTGKVGVNDFTDERANDPEVHAIRDRLVMQEDESVEQPESYATVVFKNGETLKHHVPYAKGTEGNPMTHSDLSTKFEQLSEPVLGRDATKKLIGHFEELDKANDADAITRLLGAPL